MATQLSNGNWVGISVISGIVIACLIGGIGTGIQNLNSGAPYPYAAPNQTPTPTPDHVDESPLAQGDPGLPLAIAPPQCVGACFGLQSVEDAIMANRAFSDAGLPFVDAIWSSGDGGTTAVELQAAEHDSWRQAGYSPAECFVTWSDYPFVEGADTAVGADFISPLTQHSSADFPNTLMTQSVRLFPDSISAEAYMLAVSAGVAECSAWVTASNGVSRPVTLEPALQLPSAVGSVGFVTNPEIGLRRYVFDLQLGNMVIRSVAVSDGGIDDVTFRDLVEQQAEKLATIPRLN